MFLNREVNSRGIYGVRFYIRGKPWVVEVDDSEAEAATSQERVATTFDNAGDHLHTASPGVNAENRVVEVFGQTIGLRKSRKKQAAGEAVIVYMDESYVHQNHCPKAVWCKQGKKVVRPRGKGLSFSLCNNRCDPGSNI